MYSNPSGAVVGAGALAVVSPLDPAFFVIGVVLLLAIGLLLVLRRRALKRKVADAA